MRLMMMETDDRRHSYSTAAGRRLSISSRMCIFFLGASWLEEGTRLRGFLRGDVTGAREAIPR